MKYLLGIFLVMGSAKYCSKSYPEYEKHLKTLNNTHAPMYHKMEKTLGKDAASTDSLTSAWANTFLNEFEKTFNAYYPYKPVMGELYAKKPYGLVVKAVGGNWCSDTRMQVPRLCKVLHLLGISPDNFDYYTVNKEKKPVNDDFASTVKIDRVPLIIFYIDGKEIGRIVENPQKSIEEDLLKMLQAYNK